MAIKQVDLRGYSVVTKLLQRVYLGPISEKVKQRVSLGQKQDSYMWAFRHSERERNERGKFAPFAFL